MSERIKIERSNEHLIIVIKAYQELAKQKLLLVWIVMFSSCGVGIFSQFFFNYDNYTKIFFLIYLAFWMFFEYKVIYAFRWRNAGVEKIILDGNQLVLSKEIGERVVNQVFKWNEVSMFRLFEDNRGGFVKMLTTSYWNINNYSLVFEANHNLVPFAIDLNAQDAKKILNEILLFIKKT